ncbi:28 kda golgi snare protein [Auricularia subglabra TFB-10046 SS5]|nr:28 kda golgi snare protein [Auricularia subglabra TFB-10046 SS5]
MSTFETLRRQSRTLESLVDTKLNAYSRHATSIASSSARRDVDLESGNANEERWSDMEEEIDGLLEKLRETTDELAAALDTSPTRPSPTQTHALQRHREVLQDYTRDFGRIKANVQQARDRANLLQNVRSDINAYKAAQSSTADALLTERGHIDSSHRMADDLLGQAYATRDEFASQRSTIAGINTRMAGVMTQFPGLNSLVSMIRSRRRRDSIILGLVIGVCTILLLSYVF